MKSVLKRGLSALLSVAMLAGLVLAVPPVKAEARNYGTYSDVAKVYDQGSCPSMQGMSVHGSYVYACKINGDTETSAVVARVSRTSGSTSYLTNASTGTIYFSDFGHGNDIEVETIAGVTTLFVPTSKTGSGSLVRYKISGTTATKVGSYTMVSTSGNNIGGGAIRVVHYDDTNVTFLFKSGDTCYIGTLPINQTSGNLVMSYLCTLDYSSCYVNGTYKDTSDYSLQGMGYHDFKLYLPLSGHTVSGHENISIILVYDLEGASGTIKPDPDLTFQITSSYYGALFEVESCEISPLDNRMYFSTNRRITSSDTNHDGVSYISNWTYDPTARTSDVNNYRWETRDDELVSVTDGGNVYNGLHKLQGKITDGIITDGRFALSKNVVLEHDRPWILEWKSAGSGSGALLFATAAESAVANMPYIFRRTGSSLISMGYHDGSQYNNYGLDLSDYGIDVATTHVYRMTNKIASDGSNMVYLSVDGKELGALNNYYIAGNDQGTTSNWISGQDFKFSYFGTISHNINNCQIDYIQVWGDGLAGMHDEPNTYRWESGMTSATGYGIHVNTATKISGSTSGSTYTDCRYDLSQEIVLMHDRPWVLEWDNSGTWSGGLLLSADHMSNSKYAPYIFRGGSVLAIGYHNGSKHVQWGVKLADHGIDIAAAHTYAFKNIISDDGSNMVWLYVDAQQIAPLTTVCSNGSASSSTSYYLNGKDFVFSHMGTFQHDITGGMTYLQVWEGGKPQEYQASNYRWETQNDALVSISDSTFQSNPTFAVKGTCTNGIYSDTQLMLEKSVVLLHDRPWRLEWQCEGAWTGGGLLLSTTLQSHTQGNVYLFRNSGIIAMGQHNGTQHEQWGVCPGDYDIDHSALHTYTVVNRIAEDGSNMLWLYVDGEELGPMTTACVYGTTTGETSDFLSGKDFVFNYMGTQAHPVNDISLNYLQVFEGCEHTYGSWTVTKAATCTADGAQQRSCTVCGNVDSQVITAAGHEYTMTTQEATCDQYEVYSFTCGSCGDHYTLNAGQLASGWIDYIPVGMDESLFNSKTQYRYSDYETQTSYETSLEGYTQKSGTWEQASTGSVSYVNSWPSGFSTSSSLYTQYNKKSSKVTASETATDKTVIDSDKVVGYLYYHWCYSGSTYSVAAQSGSYTTFHAYYSTTNPSTYTCDTSDMSYKTSHSSCSNSEWFFVAEVYQQSYTKYQKLFTYERWTDFSDWQDTAVTASDTRKVESRTAYQLKEATMGSHSYTASVMEPTCTGQGYTTYTCSICGDSYTQSIPATGHSYSSEVTEPTCTAQGFTTHTCTACGDSYTDSVTAVTGHSYSVKVTAPTCTDAGSKTYTCAACGHSYSEGISAAGHSYSGGFCSVCGKADPAYDTNVDYYLFGFINGTDYACEGDAENLGEYQFVDGQLTATFTQDSYVAVKTTDNGCWYMTEGWLGNDVTSATLYPTDTLFTPDKLYVPGNVEVTFTLVNHGDGTLTLSYAPTVTVTAPTITLKYPTLTFEDEILLNVYFTAENLQDVTDMGLITYSSEVSEYGIDTAKAVISGYGTNAAGTMYFATSEGIAAQCLGDTVWFAVYAQLSDGSYAYSRLVSYSPKAYAYAQLSTGSAELKALMVAMLNYGAAAQSCFSYRADALINSDLTEEQKTLISSYSASMMDAVVNADSSKVGIFTGSGGFSRKYPTVSFEEAFSINYYFTPSNTPDATVKLYYWTQADYNAATTLTADNATGVITMTDNGSGIYHAKVEGIAAKDLDRTVYVAAGYLSGGTAYCTGVLAYSIGAYCVTQASNPGASQALAQATAVYGYYAKQTFYKEI